MTTGRTKKAIGGSELAKRNDAGNLEMAEVVVQNSVRRVSQREEGGAQFQLYGHGGGG